jgi:hypothetical protein
MQIGREEDLCSLRKVPGTHTHSHELLQPAAHADLFPELAVGRLGRRLFRINTPLGKAQAPLVRAPGVLLHQIYVHLVIDGDDHCAVPALIQDLPSYDSGLGQAYVSFKHPELSATEDHTLLHYHFLHDILLVLQRLGADYPAVDLSLLVDPRKVEFGIRLRESRSLTLTNSVTRAAISTALPHFRW